MFPEARSEWLAPWPGQTRQPRDNGATFPALRGLNNTAGARPERLEDASSLDDVANRTIAGERFALMGDPFVPIEWAAEIR